MDIARISSTAYTTPAYPTPNRSRERVLDLVSELDSTTQPRVPVERVVQGEVLERPRAAYQPTHEYLNSRLFDGAYVADEHATDTSGGTSAGRSDHAVGAYLSHTRELIQPDINRGKQVDYFI